MNNEDKGAAPRKRGLPHNSTTLQGKMDQSGAAVNPGLAAAINDLSAALAKVLVAAAAPAQPDWLSQRGSPLGPVRHCAAVRRRIDAGDGGAALVGRTYLLSPEALQAELDTQSHRRVRRAPARANVTSELEQMLRGIGGRR